MFLGVNSFSPNAGVQGDMGWLSPLVRRHKLMIKFWNRLIGMSQFRLTRKIFYWNYALGDNNWATDIKALFTNIGMENVFSDKFVCNLTTAENVLYVKMCNTWEEEFTKIPNYVPMSHLNLHLDPSHTYTHICHDQNGPY